MAIYSKKNRDPTAVALSAIQELVNNRENPMADYYPLIAKALARLEKSTGEARRGLYDRARKALLAQLRGVEPVLNESDITRERLALEEAIRKVEAEAARRSRRESPPPSRPEPPPPEEAPQPARPQRPRWTPGGGSSLSDKGLKGFRDVIGEANTAGSPVPKPIPEFEPLPITVFEDPRKPRRVEPRSVRSPGPPTEMTAFSSLDELSRLIGFFSYSRQDDEDGTLSELRKRIQQRLCGLLGRSSSREATDYTLQIWQDKEAIAPGTL